MMSVKVNKDKEMYVVISEHYIIYHRSNLLINTPTIYINNCFSLLKTLHIYKIVILCNIQVKVKAMFV